MYLRMLPLCLSLAWCLSAPPGAGPDTVAAGPATQDPDRAVHMVTIHGADEDRMRLGQLFGDAPSRGFLIRSPSVLTSWPAHLEWALLAPEVHTVWNSHLPHSLNQGALWAGRGLSYRLTIGGAARYRGVTLILAPQAVHEQNRSFQVPQRPAPEGGDTRDRFANLFHFPPASMDLPIRFGDEPRNRLDPGQSSLTVERGPVAFGAATESLWWGPGIRNALIMSSQAPGVPHVFFRTREPVSTRIGTVEARWMLGRLTESDHFDFDPSNDHRSLSALVVAFSPRFEPGLSLGFARAVYAPSGGALIPVSAALDVLRSAGRPSQAPGDTLVAPGRDQLFSLFARWVFPEAGFEAYGEWGRFEQPASVRDFLELPNHSRGYTVGLQYARPVARDLRFRLQGEVTNLEPSTSFRVRPVSEWYASRTVPQGYTHRGRVLGAAIGPSGSSQWLAGDVFGDAWNAGLFAGRIRWENQSQFTYIQEFRRSDVSLMGGVRGGAELGPLRFAAEYIRTARLNYLFQGDPSNLPDERGVDIVNHTLKVTVSTGRGFSW